MTQAQKAEAPLHYPYARSYRLGEKPLSPLIANVYARLAALPESSIVLDVGSGPGRLSRNAPYPREYSFLGIDVNPEAIAAFKSAIQIESLPDLAIVGDVSAIDLSDYRRYGEINAAVSWRVLHSLPREIQIQVSKAIFDVLPPGGEFILATLADTDYKRTHLEALGQYTPGAMNDCREILGTDIPWPLFFSSEADIQELAQAAGGFQVTEQTVFQEASGFEGQPPVSYRFAVLRKPSEEVNQTNPPEVQTRRSKKRS